MLRSEEIRIAKRAIDHTESLENQLKIREKLFTISDIGVTHRWITYWDDQGLLPTDYQPGKWRRFDFIEYVWLKIIIRLRELNIKLSILRLVRETLLTPHPVSEIMNQQEIRQGIKEFSGLSSDEIDAKLDSRETQAEANKATFDVLSLLVQDALLFKNHLSLLINNSGQFTVVKAEALIDHINNQDFMEFIKNTYVSVSISEIIFTAFDEIGVDTLQVSLGLISEQEAEILRQLRSGNLKSIKIYFGPGNQIEVIEKTEVLPASRSSKVIEMIRSNGYHTIECKTKDGKVLYFEHTTKRKI